jgi:transcriptional regulator with XRE-family HTH domain
MDKNDEIESQIKQVAARLKQEREKVRISQMELSFLAGLSQNQVFCIETGRRVPNLYTILKICNALHISPSILFGSENEERSQAKETIINLITKYI